MSRIEEQIIRILRDIEETKDSKKAHLAACNATLKDLNRHLIDALAEHASGQKRIEG